MSDYSDDSEATFDDDDDYDSIDEEFLAYHDANIEAQVRDCLEKMQKRRDLAELRVSHLVEDSDREEIERIRLQQVDLLGGCEKMYEILDKNLRCLSYQPCLAADQYKLYAWRKEFFILHFPEESWYTYGDVLDVLPYQITVNWAELVALACSPNKDEEIIYLQSNSKTSMQVVSRFDMSDLPFFVHKTSIDRAELAFGDVAHMIAALYPRGPPSLKQLSLRTCIVHKFSLDEVPNSLKLKVKIGFLEDPADPVPDHINDDGRELFTKLKSSFIGSSINEIDDVEHG